MSERRRVPFLITIAIVLALLGSLLSETPAQAQNPYWFPHMTVTPHVGSNYFSGSGTVGVKLAFQVNVANDGSTPLKVVANLATPNQWVLNAQYGTCPEFLAAGSSCVLTWEFTPGMSGQFLVRVYVRGLYTDSVGNAQRITASPGFYFNISTSPVNTLLSASAYVSPVTITPGASMSVAPHVGIAYSMKTSQVGNQINFETTILNNGTVPLVVLASLAPPANWEVIGQFNDCPPGPAGLLSKASCTYTWQFIPRISGKTYVRVYVRGFYVDPLGIVQRITKSPAFLFDIAP